MADSRTKNTSRNLFWGVSSKMITILLNFFSRTIILYLLGEKFLGISTLYTSVLSFLSLAELGLSSAIIYTMYKPVADNDYVTIGALLNFYKKLYRIIGLTILVVGGVLLPFIPYLMNGDAPEGANVYILYLLYLLNSVIGYFFAGYRQSLLSAYQRQDIITNITTGSVALMYLLQIAILLLTENFYVYATIPIFTTVLTNIGIAIITYKRYPDIKVTGKVEPSTVQAIKKRLSGLIGTKLNSIVVHSADTIVISAFLGLTLTAQYGNYYYVFNSVCSFLVIIFVSMTPSIGNKLVTDKLESNYALFQNLQFGNAWIVTWCSVCFICLFEPFMEVWAGADMCLGLGFVIPFVAYFFIYEIQRTILAFKDAAGLWHKDKWRPYVSMIVNVISNVIFVNFFGIYGVVVSSVLAFLISMPWANMVLFRNLFKTSPWKNIWQITKYAVVTAILSAITYFACMICHDGILGIVERFILCCIIPNALFILFFCKSKEFIYWKTKINTIFQKRRG